jgi:L,D-transpeptidase ErfK/SrfK
MINKFYSYWLLLLGVIAMTYNVHATILVIPEQGDLVGDIQHTYSEIGETIDEVGRRFDVGYYDMVRANPHADPIHTLAAHTPLIIPSRFILPPGKRTGIVINLAAYRLYYFPPDENIVVTFPIGIGKEGWSTPTGVTKVTAKAVNPTWKPTADVLAAAEKMGAPLPGVFPPGPNNPLGKHVLRLGWPAFLIHGTNRVDGVGARVSAGCIRMLPSDIEYLYELVSIGTPVKVINEPVNIGKQDGSVFLQIHPSLAEHKKEKLDVILNIKLKSFNMKNQNDNVVVRQELSKPSGIVKRL